MLSYLASAIWNLSAVCLVLRFTATSLSNRRRAFGPPHPYLHFHPVALKHRAPLGKGLLWHSSIRLKRKKLPCYCLSSMWHHNSTPYIFPQAQNTPNKIVHNFGYHFCRKQGVSCNAVIATTVLRGISCVDVTCLS